MKKIITISISIILGLVVLSNVFADAAITNPTSMDNLVNGVKTTVEKIKSKNIIFFNRYVLSISNTHINQHLLSKVNVKIEKYEELKKDNKYVNDINIWLSKLDVILNSNENKEEFLKYMYDIISTFNYLLENKPDKINVEIMNRMYKEDFLIFYHKDEFIRLFENMK